ncbi:MAG: ATP-binding protein [Pseudomonadota bacterium]
MSHIVEGTGSSGIACEKPEKNRMHFNVFQWRSLKTKMTLFTLAIFLIGIWSLAFYANRALREDMQRLSGEQQFSMVSFIASAVNEELENRLKSLKNVAEQIGPAMPGNPETMQALLEQRPILQILFNGGVIATRIDGTAIADIPLSAGRIGVNYMDIDTIAAALMEGKSSVGRPVIGKKLPAPVFGMTVPICDTHGEVIGALSGVTDLSRPNFLDKITEGRYGKTGGYLLVAPQHRLIVAASDKSRIMEASPAPGIYPLIDRFMHGFEGTGVGVNPIGVEVLASAKGVPAAGWYVNVALPTEEAFSPIRALQQRILLAMIFVTLLVGGLTWWMLKRLLSPMLSAARALAILPVTDQPPQPLPITCHDEIGELIGGFNRLLETLAQREAEKAELEARNRQLQKTESLGRMAGAIAHHFNNQLQVVMGNLEMAMDELPREPDNLEILSEAMQAARRAAKVSGLMLTYLGQTPGKRETVDLSEACRQSLILLQSAVPKGMILKVDLPASGPVIRANAGQIQQTLTNLITNACEAAGESKGTFGLTVKSVSRADIPASKRFPIDWQPRESVYACLEVADAGCGIASKDIEKIFDPFFTTKFTGRGLGLPVVLGITGAHDGGITVESEPGRGSVFRVFLPVSTEEIHHQKEDHYEKE